MVGCAAGDCAPIILGIDSRMDLNGIELRAEITGPEARAFLLFEGGALSNGSTLLGFSSPWVTIGPLLPRGLFRELENPLGFKAGGDIFRERTNLLLDGSLTPGGYQGILLAPFSGAFSIFCGFREPDGVRTGCFVSLSLAQGFFLEGLSEYSRPPERSPTEKWFPVVVPFAGGEIIHAAGRMLWEAPLFSFAVSLCFSGCRLALPGCLVHSDFSVGGKDLSAAVFFGAAQREYMTMGGSGSPDRLGLGIITHASLPQGTADLHYSFSLGQEEFSPCRFTASSEKAGFSLEKTLWGEGLKGLRIRVDGENEAHCDDSGCRSGSAEGTLGIAWTLLGESSRLGFTLTDAGPRVSYDIAVSLSNVRFGLEGNIGMTRNGMVMTALCNIKRAEKTGTLTFKVGVQEMPVVDGILDLSSLRMNVGWEARSEVPAP
jgi:hypothetical protein